MIGLALRHLLHHRLRTLLLVLAVGVGVALPWAVHRLVGQYERGLAARAAATPLVLGATGNRFDLVLSALYFRRADLTPVTQAHVDAVRASGLAAAYPLHLAFTAGGHPLVGTSVDYFGFRGLVAARGRLPGVLGDAVLGANVAEATGLGPGGTLLTDQRDLYDLAATYPLQLNVVGVLAPAGTPDDDAVFVDLKTTWTVAGIAHGHQDLAAVARADERVVTADASLQQYQVITPENLDSFHMHGDPAGFPVTAVIVQPHDARSSTLLKARYRVDVKDAQLLAPQATIEELMGIVLRVRRFLDANFALVGAATALLLGLIVALSLRTRDAERATLVHLGAGRGFVLGLFVAEWVVIGLLAVALAWLSVLTVGWLAPTVSTL